MPNYEYRCEDCEVEFEELLLHKEEIEKYKSEYPCPSCGNMARKIMSAVSFGFKQEVRGLGGVHGNSGVHDFDYPSLDKAVARSSEKRWAFNRQRQEAINKVRQETGTHAVSMDNNGNFVPTNNSILEKRQAAMPVVKKLAENSKKK
jgi:putative FmdB family regulatory protein